MKKNWNKQFVDYMYFIINHPNYKGLPILKKADGSYSWIAPAKSMIGKKRIEWAKSKMKELNISENDSNPYAKLMFEIHPTKEKVCQICGKSMSLYYIYINTNLAKAIKKRFNYDASTNQTLFEVCSDLLSLKYTEKEIKLFLQTSFNISSYDDSIENIIKKCEELCRNGKSKKLGPRCYVKFSGSF